MNRSKPFPTAEEMMTQAREQTGFSNFGKPTFVNGLERCLQSLEEDARVTPEGRSKVLAIWLRRLGRRLEIEEWFKNHPETENLAIVGPISICGLPRTGTTALGNMMSLDTRFRSLRMWEQQQPIPPPELATEMEDPRRLAYVKEIADLVRDQPEHHAMHLYEADATIEDVELLGFQFHGQDMTLPIFGYHAWWRASDMRPTYEYHRRVASLLQSKRPPNSWLFKAPHHKFHLEAIIHAYPDARFVFTHRDPAKSVPSYVSLVSSLYPPGTLASHDIKNVGRKVHEHLLDGMRLAVEARKRIGSDRFVDVYQRDIEADALGTLRRIYDALGIECTSALQDSIAKWAAANRSGAYGAHKYTAEQFGLSVDQIRSDFDFYIREFDIPIVR